MFSEGKRDMFKILRESWTRVGIKIGMFGVCVAVSSYKNRRFWNFLSALNTIFETCRLCQKILIELTLIRSDKLVIFFLVSVLKFSLFFQENKPHPTNHVNEQSPDEILPIQFEKHFYKESYFLTDNLCGMFCDLDISLFQ